MGFGILFFACFLTYFGALTPISAFTYVLGTAMMLWSLYKLSSQNKLFVAASVADFLLFVVSLIIVALYVFGVKNAFYDALITIQVVLSPVVLAILLVAIFYLAKEVELKKIQGWSIVDFIFVCLNVICNVISLFVSSEMVISRLGLVFVVSQVLYASLALFILFNCYARICYEDDVNMEKEETGVAAFDFLNKLFNKATDKNRKNGPGDKGGK